MADARTVRGAGQAVEGHRRVTLRPCLRPIFSDDGVMRGDGGSAGRSLRLVAGGCTAAVLAMAAGSACAQPDRPAPGPDRSGILTLQFENDFLGDTDGHFTHGTRIAWMSPEDEVPGWVIAAADHVPLFDAKASKRIVWSLGQSMFTPDDISIADPGPRDRPYAGWLYLGVGLVSVNEERLDNLELNLGVVGPASQAGRMQRLWHRTFGLQEPKGWGTQLRNEPGFLLMYDRKWRAWQRFGVAGLGGDIAPNAGFALGNVFTHAQVGLTARVGRDLPADYGPPRIRPSQPGSDYFLPGEDFGWYFFFGVAGRAVARNVFLDGNSFRDSHSVDKRYFVGDVQAGLAVTLGGARLAYTHILRSREYMGQNKPDHFGSLSLSVRF
jgi:lipid A 3-O-deacylase